MRKLETFELQFVPHVEPVLFTIKARTREEALQRFERQVFRQRGKAYKQVREQLATNMRNYAERANGNFYLAPCHCLTVAPGEGAGTRANGGV